MRKMLHEDEEVIYIEYCDGLPLSVITATLEGGGLTYYDFEHIGSDRADIQYYNAGMGGSRKDIQAPHFVSGKGKQYWMANGCKFRGRTKAINCKRIDRPLQLRGWLRRSINPFKVADENPYGFEWCKECQQHYSREDGCRDHHTWSDEHGCFVYEDGSKAD